MLDLTGKVILITGAAQGVGAAIAQAVQGAGAEGIALTDRTDMGAAAPNTLHIIADLSDPEAPATIIAATLARFGRIDGLVNVAGLTDRASLLTADLVTWDRLLAVNTRAPFFLMQGAVRDMLARNSSGTIVNILSINAHCGAPDLAIYSATKAALSNLTKNTANAHKSDGIRVNGLNLGWVETPAEHDMQTNTLGRGSGWLAEDSAKLPLARLLSPQECARHALYLLSDFSAPITGTLIDVDQNVTGAPA